MKTLLYGTTASVLTAVISLLWVSFEKAHQFTFTAGIIIWLLASLFSGAFKGFGSKDVFTREPYAHESIAHESMEDRASRWRHSQILFLFGLPFVVIGAAMYFYK